MLASTFTTAAVAAIVALASNPMTLFALGATALGGLYLRFIKGTARQALVETLTKRAFNCVEDLKAQGKLPPGTDKPVLALEFLAKQLSAHGLTLTTGIEDLARAIWSSMHAPESEVTTTATASTAGFKATAQIVETPAPIARRVGFIGAALLACLFCLPQIGCVTGWTAAEKAAPACYGLDGSSLTTIINQGKQTVQDAAGCATNAAVCVVNAEDALGAVLANYSLDKQMFLCVTEAIKLELAFPNGDEPAYVPDAGTAVASSDAGVVVAGTAGLTRKTSKLGVDHSLALYNATQLTPLQQAQVDAVTNLQAHTNL
jgi:hypothetical protein